MTAMIITGAASLLAGLVIGFALGHGSCCECPCADSCPRSDCAKWRT